VKLKQSITLVDLRQRHQFRREFSSVVLAHKHLRQMFYNLAAKKFPGRYFSSKFGARGSNTMLPYRLK